jgi:hypothetical protein
MIADTSLLAFLEGLIADTRQDHTYANCGISWRLLSVVQSDD